MEENIKISLNQLKSGNDKDSKVIARIKPMKIREFDINNSQVSS